jgi:hypothetical protein
LGFEIRFNLWAMCVLLPCTYLIALILVPCIFFVHVVWPRGFALWYLQVTSLHEKQLVSHLPTRHSCFAPSFLSCFLYVLQQYDPSHDVRPILLEWDLSMLVPEIGLFPELTAKMFGKYAFLEPQAFPELWSSSNTGNISLSHIMLHPTWRFQVELAKQSTFLHHTPRKKLGTDPSTTQIRPQLGNHYLKASAPPCYFENTTIVVFSWHPISIRRNFDTPSKKLGILGGSCMRPGHTQSFLLPSGTTMSAVRFSLPFSFVWENDRVKINPFNHVVKNHSCMNPKRFSFLLIENQDCSYYPFADDVKNEELRLLGQSRSIEKKTKVH